jgi:hypothetical protein
MDKFIFEIKEEQLEMEKQEEVTLDEGNIATKLIEPTS